VQFRETAVTRRVWVAVACALAATAGWWSWTRSHRPVMAASMPPVRPFVRFAGNGNTASDQILRERADLLDPTPLFFPTEWNYGQRPLPISLRRQPGQVFSSFEPKMTFEDQELKLTAPEIVAAPEGPADVLAQGNVAPFAGMGQVDATHVPLPERSGYVEVRGLNSDKPVIEQPLLGLTLPRPDYSPIEFIVAVTAGGVVGDPVLTSGSGWDDVDAFFRTYLVKTFRIGERLNPGRYRVSIGP
jgi:hypothetical protein